MEAAGIEPQPGAGASASPAASALPLPPFASIKKLELRSRQGGPSHPKCGGVVSELVVDLLAGQWTRGFCTDASPQASPDPKRPLDRRSGKLTAEHRALLEREYAKLVRQRGPSCGADVGRTELTVHQSAAKAFIVNSGSSCSDAPPDFAEGLDDFLSRAFTITSPSARP